MIRSSSLLIHCINQLSNCKRETEDRKINGKIIRLKCLIEKGRIRRLRKRRLNKKNPPESLPFRGKREVCDDISWEGIPRPSLTLEQSVQLKMKDLLMTSLLLKVNQLQSVKHVIINIIDYNQTK